MIYAALNTNKICYMILPEGIREDLDVGLKKLSENILTEVLYQYLYGQQRV